MTTSQMPKLSKRDIHILQYIIDVRAEFGISPSYREIRDEFALSSIEQVTRSINKLRKANFVVLNSSHERKARTLVPTRAAIEYIRRVRDLI